MPLAIASRGEEILTSSPRTRIRPPSAGYIPYSTRIKVDLPAPFSPISAWTSPARSSRSTSSFASTPGKRLVMRSRTTRGGVALPPAPSPPVTLLPRPALRTLGRVGNDDGSVDDLLLELVELLRDVRGELIRVR